MYKYEDIKNEIFTESGQEKFLQIRDQVALKLKNSGAVMMEKAIDGALGDSWLSLACVDRLVELKEIKEIPTNGAALHRVFIAGRNQL